MYKWFTEIKKLGYVKGDSQTVGYIFCSFSELMELYDIPHDLDYKINFIWTLGLFKTNKLIKKFYIYDWDSNIKPEEIISSGEPISWRIGTNTKESWLEDFKDFQISIQIDLWNIRTS